MIAQIPKTRILNNYLGTLYIRETIELVTTITTIAQFAILFLEIGYGIPLL